MQALRSQTASVIITSTPPTGVFRHHTATPHCSRFLRKLKDPMERTDGRSAGQIRYGASHMPCGIDAPLPPPPAAACYRLPHLRHLPTCATCSRLRRTVRCERGLLTRADGSAQWTQGGTSCLASVTGPTQSYASSKEDAERATVDVVFRPRSGLAGALRRLHGTARWIVHVSRCCSLLGAATAVALEWL